MHRPARLVLAPLLLALSAPAALAADAESGALTVEQISPGYAVRAQITAGDLARLAAMGFRTVINSRPDGEEPGQPEAEELAAEAHRLGLTYHHIPVAPSGPTETEARKLRAALTTAPGPVLGFCRSGRRAARLKELADSLGPRGGSD
ncbi:TIGR01244 family sulfur transferase [Novosphingobium sp.]|uniref:TIGR01244 family sulfur transferase n=1 Tax=Novosphingobium sp. TaxID=1874826 RepID=UPI0035AE5BC2